MQTLQISIYTLGFLVVLALLFDFMNGFHDAANAIATVVSTGVLRPQTAVAMAALFNFIAVLVFQLKVAATVGKGTVDPSIVDHYVVFGALVGAILWNLITWYYGIPSSSSHALIGGLFGGWRIVKTMGQKITKLKPVGGFCAETGGAITLFIATALGIPVSTTHTITGAIVGDGSAKKMSAVRWGIAGNIVWAWIFTIPASACMAAIAWWIGTQLL